MTVYYCDLNKNTKGEVDIVDITSNVQESINKSNI
jgi:hypothetical protein